MKSKEWEVNGELRREHRISSSSPTQGIHLCDVRNGREATLGSLILIAEDIEILREVK